MRRLQPHSLPRFLREGEPPPREARQPPGLWTASFELRSITPILGGGVLSFQPDTVDFVRPASLRGPLRWWWRALYHSLDEDPDALFAEEARLWGGVGLPRTAGEEGKEKPGLQSRVRLAVEIVDPGKTAPSGAHERGDNGRLKALPRWRIGQRLGYALFPLQQVKEERDRFERDKPRQEMPTRLVRTGVHFRLRVTLAGSKPGLSPTRADVTQVLAALWAWVHFGGLGARTRRGFGALEIAGPAALDPVAELDVETWRRLFQGPRESRDIAGWLQAFERAASPHGRAWPCQILVGSGRRDASTAHEEIVDLLKCFRQEPGFAREPGNPRPGQSRWPEPHLLRALAPGSGRFEHEPPQDLIAQAREGQIGAPRAAFGLPIQVQFYFQHRGDQRADATLSHPEGQRWPSPLLLRPLRTTQGDYHPAAVFLPIPPPAEVVIEYKDTDKTKKKAPVQKSAGSRNDIARLLGAAHGKALQAFAEWLINNKGYRR